MNGKEKRMSRIFRGHERAIILPLDHGFSEGPIKGLEKLGDTLQKIMECKIVDSMILHGGPIKNNYQLLNNNDIGLIMHLSGSTALSTSGLLKIQTATVKEAVRMGCDAVSIHINLGNGYEAKMLQDTANIIQDCNDAGMPLIAMVYVRGDKIDNEWDIKYIKHAVRVMDELGADMVKVNYCNSKSGFAEVIESCQIPVIIAGGQQMDTESLLTMISNAMDCGAKGISIGRNIFQSDNYTELLNDIHGIVHQNVRVDDLIGKYRLESKTTFMVNSNEIKALA
ncbi:MAG: 2-amino-3,7-dideoxy-D-threo-hept-6-ulosonate synthase [Lachnospiraceae bacterium]|nr:2-amino-3,7-dideoxy-D-threo-hept-6-ulosonate synthase [Lachnospiraceae bacterium]